MFQVQNIQILKCHVLISSNLDLNSSQSSFLGTKSYFISNVSFLRFVVCLGEIFITLNNILKKVLRLLFTMSD